MMNDMDESYFDWSDEDDIICSSKYISSDEEDDNLADVIIASKRQRTGGSVFQSKKKKDEEDDFEKEMATELSQTMQTLTSTLGVQGSSGASQKTDARPKEAPEFYDDVYFDSDESDHEETTPGQASKAKKSHHRRRKVLSNDELFYDPTMDERDQEWVNQKRRSYQPRERRPGRTLGVENNNTIQLPPSDAVLNCPACLTTLCMDCQRHEIYHNQYRAMFVFNCTVDVTERLSYPCKDQKRRDFLKNKKARKNIKQGVQLENEEEAEGEPRLTEVAAASTVGSSVEETHSTSQSTNATENNSIDELPTREPEKSINDVGQDAFHPVMCKICNTKVAVYDSDEVYHFFNVVTSY
ncbi:E2F-associated phosphoprotein [Chionoecetes opilio]|uniref:E2F-associated phosphoprotein n=1 Tax=Chionoecetes opilio TaxID=41210 RepID=A0A8J4XRJ7_CHIOP|nr:E2F-associated phosphoprotein [Chionoecetes opilio]